MIYSETELQQIEKYASIYLKISDIADRGTDVSKAYRRGKAASKVKLHSQEMMLDRSARLSLSRTPTAIYWIWKMMNSRNFCNFAL